jgi:hypothetical protein
LDGPHATQQAAARRYDELCIAACGEHARTNFPLANYPPHLIAEGNLRHRETMLQQVRLHAQNWCARLQQPSSFALCRRALWPHSVLAGW